MGPFGGSEIGRATGSAIRARPDSVGRRFLIYPFQDAGACQEGGGAVFALVTDGLVGRAPISCGGDSPRAGSASAGPVRGLSPQRLSLVYLVAKPWEQGRRRTAEVTATHPTGYELQNRAW